MKALDLTYYWMMELKGLIKVISTTGNGVYYIDKTDGKGYCEITDGYSEFEYYCNGEEQFLELCAEMR